MPRFKFQFRRTYSIVEGFDRVVEADTLEDAIAIADAAASEYDHDCPDDNSEDERGGAEIGDFEAAFETETTDAPDLPVEVDAPKSDIVRQHAEAAVMTGWTIVIFLCWI